MVSKISLGLFVIATLFWIEYGAFAVPYAIAFIVYMVIYGLSSIDATQVIIKEKKRKGPPPIKNVDKNK